MQIRDIATKLEENGYYSNEEINYAVLAAVKSKMPILVEGAAGAGKTSLAYAIAKMMGLPLLRVQFYDGVTDDKILYDYDYQKQLLTLEAVKPALEKEYKNKSVQEAIEDVSGKLDFYGPDFLIKRPVLHSIDGSGRKVLLLDEIDKAPEEVEYTLLEVLSEFSMSIPQYGTVVCPEDQIPIVILTSNNYRELSDALKRRCGYLFIEQKTKDEMIEILKKQVSIGDKLANNIATCLELAQAASLMQTPSIAEGIQWAKFLADNMDESLKVENTLGILLKNKKDMEKMRGIVRKSFEK